jgi:Holliday junction resolvase
METKTEPEGIAPRKHRGAQSELIACAWLLGRGFEVFRNVSPHGESDIITIKDGVVTRIDVKSSWHGYCARLSPEQIEQGVAPFYVFDSGSCYFPRYAGEDDAAKISELAA